MSAIAVPGLYVVMKPLGKFGVPVDAELVVEIVGIVVRVAFADG